ncbi:hypothetical protein [Acidaminococcus massiliensis]|jgi:hypothetical protein|uniref:hypothetical protein n=1 Tax=Acidaminococcus massiliensis TaxID=1852375 RepID=UPI0023F582B7|nr:hypothetical protein [Acidaminococcus massiliensis]
MIMSIFFLLGAFRTFYYVIGEAAEKKTAWTWRVMFGLLGLAELLLAFHLSPFSAALGNLEELRTVYHYLIRAVVVLFLILGWTESKNLESKTQKKVKSNMLRVYIALLIYVALKYL